MLNNNLRGRETIIGSKNSYLLARSLYIYNARDCSKTKLGSPSQVAGSRLLEPLVLPLRVCISRKQELTAELGIVPRFSIVGCACLNCHLNL